jgi:hypothetical protein
LSPLGSVFVSWPTQMDANRYGVKTSARRNPSRFMICVRFELFRVRDSMTIAASQSGLLPFCWHRESARTEIASKAGNVIE